MNNTYRTILLATLLFLIPSIGFANDLNLDLLKVTEGGEGAQTYSVSIQILAIMTMLSLLPAIVLMMTSFTRIIIVLAILRQALGMPQTPSNQIIIGLALFLSLFIMTPIISDINNNSIQPYLANTISQETAIKEAVEPVKKFMFQQTREADLLLFSGLSNSTAAIDDISSVPLPILIPAFITSELKTAFQIGFIIFIPFLIIDLVVASVLMSMGMMMMSPLIISLPFKLMLFVLVDGWNLLMGTLATSFAVGAL
tara:strand:+ start:102110 stop:102874 length:765 start_codon:yes stop_codon:yes gene_type:complete